MALDTIVAAALALCVILAQVMERCQVAGSHVSLLQLEYEEEERKMKADKVRWSAMEVFYNESESIHEFKPDDKLCEQHRRALEDPLQRRVQMHQRVLSPWRYVKNYDSRRAPEHRYVLDAACICRGCFAPQEDGYGNLRYVYTEQMYSVPVTAPRVVRMPDGSFRSETVRVGCHCMYPYGVISGFNPSDDSYNLNP